MTILAALCQIVIALGIFNVWVLRRNRPTPYRPDGASTLTEEFERYGLPGWSRIAVGATKLTLAVLLILALALPALALPAAAAMSILMVGAIIAHVKVGDPLSRSVPAVAMLLMSAIVVVSHSPWGAI